MLIPLEIRTAVWVVTVLATCLIALRRGGLNERLAAGGLLIGWLATVLVYKSFDNTEWGVLAIDITLLVLLIWIALRSDRFWPIFAAGFHLLAVVTHMARSADAGVGRFAYLTAEIFWGYLLAGCIAVAAWRTPKFQAVNAAAPAMAGATRR